MKKLISMILSAAMLITGASAAAETTTGYGDRNSIKTMVYLWEYQIIEGYSMGSYSNGGPTVDDNGDYLAPLRSLSVFWDYSSVVESDTLMLYCESRTIEVPLKAGTAVVDGKEIEFPHTAVTLPDILWDGEPYTEIYFHYSYIPEIFGVESAEWDKDNLTLTITENESTPMSNAKREQRKLSMTLDRGETALPTPAPHLKEQEIEPLPPTDNRSAYIGTPSQFSDMTDTSSLLNTCVNELTDRGVISGYEDGTFRPDSYVTRAEAAAMICRLMGFEMQGESSFTDVPPGEWYAAPVGAITEIGIVNGYEDGTFRPNNNITYHEMFKIIYCLLGEPNAFYQSLISYAVRDGFAGELSSFGDDYPVTRGDMCIMLSRALDTYITTWETDDGNEYYGDSEMTLYDYLDGKPTVYNYFCSMKQYEEYGNMVKSQN
ncbi:MAG: S-layer homology domain-containing protein [Candidatus Ornithomonoglobus sp.]